VVLRDYYYSKVVKKKPETEIIFEVAEDVIVDGIPVIRKGARELA
jgi:hypothetical protein